MLWLKITAKNHVGHVINHGKFLKNLILIQFKLILKGNLQILNNSVINLVKHIKKFLQTQ